VAAWYMNERRWQSLAQEDRELFRRAARAGGQVATDLGDVLDRDAMNTLKMAGVTYVVPDATAFNAVWSDVHKAYEGKVWPAGLVERIRAAQKQP
jgi:TRAP-type transport system periplasmic protein